tara:strand:+ start:42 stop:194 length:153 start_codon:yes stop_codon:yes gene_type:complete
MNVIIIGIIGLITLVSLLGNLYILITVIRGAYTPKRESKKKRKKTSRKNK